MGLWEKYFLEKVILLEMKKKITSLAQVRDHKNILQIKFQVSECPNFDTFYFLKASLIIYFIIKLYNSLILAFKTHVTDHHQSNSILEETFGENLQKVRTMSSLSVGQIQLV